MQKGNKNGPGQAYGLGRKLESFVMIVGRRDGHPRNKGVIVVASHGLLPVLFLCL